jgi:hypothetical protein
MFASDGKYDIALRATIAASIEERRLTACST